MLEKNFINGGIEVGCDEAGRGCLAGPVVAAAVIWPSDLSCDKINDSKKLSPSTRKKLRDFIIENVSHWSIAFVEPHEIDKINILNASILAMHKALEQLKTNFDRIIIDGKYFKNYKNIPHYCIIKGDQKYYSIAAASILAKTFRDEYMEKLHKIYPVFNWQKNKGYPTIQHRQAILEHGYSPYHRKSFVIKDFQLTLF